MHYITDYLNNNLNDFFLANNKHIIGNETGLKSIDNITEGIYGLVGLTGEPGKGKTSMGIQIACHNLFQANIPKPVIYISLEVNKTLLLSKIFAFLADTSFKKVLKGGLNIKESEDYLNNLLLVNDNKSFVVLSPEQATFSNIKNNIISLEKDYQLKYGIHEKVLVILDYLNIYNHLPKNLNDIKIDKLEKTNLQMLEFINMRNQLNANFLILLSKNKQGYKKQDLGVIKGSGDLEYGFETIMSLDEVPENFPISDYPPSLDFQEVNVVLNILKNRWGENGMKIPFFFNGQKNKFIEPYV